MDKGQYIEYLRKVVAHESMGEEERREGIDELRRRAQDLIRQQDKANEVFWKAEDSARWTVIYMISNDLERFFGPASETVLDLIRDVVVRALILAYWVGRREERLACLLNDVDVGEEE